MNKTIRVMTRNGVVSANMIKRVKMYEDLGFTIQVVDMSKETDCGIKINEIWLDEIIP